MTFPFLWVHWASELESNAYCLWATVKMLQLFFILLFKYLLFKILIQVCAIAFSIKWEFSLQDI